MTSIDLARRRLRNSRLAGAPVESAEGVVRWLCAVQSQDYAAAKWAVAQRARGVTDVGIDRLFNEGAILRTHVLRPTWHFVMPADIRWMLQLTGPRVKQAIAYYDRVLGLDAPAFARGRRALARVFQDGAVLTRKEIGDMLRRSGLDVDNRRLGHLLMHAELDGVVCSGGLRGRQFTYALLDERVPTTASLDREEALAELAARYFASHGPAQLRDFAWWSGLTITQARRATELARPSLERFTGDGVAYLFMNAPAGGAATSPQVHLLPNFDEYLVGYADRSSHFDPAVFATPPTGMELLANSVVVDGRVVGGWRRTVSGDEVTVAASLRRPLTTAQRAALERARERYSTFLGKRVTLTAAAESTQG